MNRPEEESGAGKSQPEMSNGDFEKEASRGSSGALAEFWHYLMNNKKWWLTPIIIVLLLMSLLIIIAGSGAAPFIYTLF